MTTLYATYQTNLDSYNLNYWYANLDSEEFNEDANQGGFIDNYFLYVGSDALALYGSDFGYLNTDMYYGTIEALSQWAWVPDASAALGGYWEEGWHWTGWDLDMSTFFDAGATPDTGDDLNLIKQVMSDDDTLYLSDFDDSFQGFQGNDSMYGGDGHDTLSGDDGTDFLFGGKNGDMLYGGHDSDTLSGGAGEDYLDGGTGDDLLRGGTHRDTLEGGSGNYTLEGGSFNDNLSGNNGKDKLYGGDGDDTLRGGDHRDVLEGGRGADTFLFLAGDAKDVILDFDTRGIIQDVIDLSDLAYISDFADLVDNHMEQRNTRVVIDFEDDGRIVLRDTDLSDLDASHFIFA